MASYKYEAANAAGKIEQGVLEADSARAGRAQLRARGLTPLSVDPVSTGAKAANDENAGLLNQSLRSFSRRFSESELALATRQFASLLSAKLALAAALAATAEQTEHKGVREVFSAVRSEVLAGHRLADALGQYPLEFPQVYRATIAAGEQSGDLAKVMERLADYIEERQALRNKVITAFVYPAVVTAVAVAIVLFLMTYVVPQVVGVFAQSKQELPLPTRVLLAISAGVRSYGWYGLAVIVAGVFGLRWLFKQPGPKASLDAFLLRVPIIGRLVRGINTARFASTLAILTSSSVPLLRALQAARATLTNTVLINAVAQAETRVREGAPLARSLASTKAFAPVLIHLIDSGEQTGEVAGMLERAARNQSHEVERRVMTLTTLLEPLLILLMGAVVLGIVLAVLMPIIEINQMVR